MDFDMLGLHPRLLAALAEQGIATPTPIQTQAIPHAMQGADVMGLAQTGTGKTLAFGLPMLDRMLKEPQKAIPRGTHALILAPTRELARQIGDTLAAMAGAQSHLKVVLVTGGAGIGGQIQRLERGAAVIVATPGRLIDLIDRKAVDLSRTRFLVLDEADQMLDLGFIHALRRIAPLLPAERQTMLFSATMPKQMEELAQSYLNRPVRVQVNPPGQAAERIAQSVHYVAKAAKFDLLVDLLDAHRDELALVFGRTKHGMEKLSRMLEQKGFAVAAIHGNKSQGQRDRALDAFREGRLRVLVATDVAARGLDIPLVRHVYNYELPNVPENYVHRIGRTARAGADGAAIALVAPDEMGELRDIEKTLKARIPVASGAPWEVPVEAAAPRRGAGRGQGKPAGRVHGHSARAPSSAPANTPSHPRRRRPQGGRNPAA
ncbi:MAG: DEAD/DEAH box helicase [Rubellimicrobium sp.]|nr:DEAD/DEAH box helicase [Rubellimicrobium sp.]